MTLSEITNKLKYDISDTLKRVAGKLSFRKDRSSESSSGASNRPSFKK
jgi:hypothetical protein